MGEEYKVCVFCERPFHEFGDAGKWKCRYHPGKVKDGKWDCCNTRYAYENPNRSFGSDYRSMQRYRRATFPHEVTEKEFDIQGGGTRKVLRYNFSVGCQPCDHIHRNIEQQEIRQACHSDYIKAEELSQRKGWCGKNFKLYWCEAEKLNCDI